MMNCRWQRDYTASNKTFIHSFLPGGSRIQNCHWGLCFSFQYNENQKQCKGNCSAMSRSADVSHVACLIHERTEDLPYNPCFWTQIPFRPFHWGGSGTTCDILATSHKRIVYCPQWGGVPSVTSLKHQHGYPLYRQRGVRPIYRWRSHSKGAFQHICRAAVDAAEHFQGRVCPCEQLTTITPDEDNSDDQKEIGRVTHILTSTLTAYLTPAQP